MTWNERYLKLQWESIGVQFWILTRSIWLKGKNSRSDVIKSFFFLLRLLSHWQQTRTKRRGRRIYSLSFFFFFFSSASNIYALVCHPHFCVIKYGKQVVAPLLIIFDRQICFEISSTNNWHDKLIKYKYNH
jgi:hypothetical protein